MSKTGESWEKKFRKVAFINGKPYLNGKLLTVSEYSAIFKEAERDGYCLPLLTTSLGDSTEQDEKAKGEQ